MGKYKGKTDTQSWNEESMHQAMEEILGGRICYHKASKEFGQPQTTIKVIIKK